MIPQGLDAAKILSPRRNTTKAETYEALAAEQLIHFGIDKNSPYGETLLETARHLYETQADFSKLWQITNETLEELDKGERIAYFNAKRFLSFQLAKILDSLQNPFRKVSQSLSGSTGTQIAKGSYPLFDNITAIFSATPVIARTATYYFACTEWVDDAFHGREMTHQIYSRLLNPTSISLANSIVDLEAGPYTGDYMAWNFNSGMAAIDSLLSNVLNRGDILIVSRNVYGGVHQLLVDFYAKANRMDIKIEWFDGYSAEAFETRLNEVKSQYKASLESHRLHIYIESPCNPHGYVLDVPNICQIAHGAGDHLVMLDSTLATPMLNKPLQRENAMQRPDYVVHSYTKDISGSGSATSGVVIGQAHRMFLPKGDTVNGVSWDQTMFWDVYFIKGAFLDADKAYEVLIGMKTLEHRMLSKVINTIIFTRFLNSHEDFRVNSHALESNENYQLRADCLHLGLPSALFTVDMESAGLSSVTFKRFFDSLEPGFGLMVSIGQSNTMVLCPALTSHSELSEQAMQRARIYPTTMRISMGNENVKDLIASFIHAAKNHIEPLHPGFVSKFMSYDSIDSLVERTTLDVHRRVLANQTKMVDLVDEK